MEALARDSFFFRLLSGVFSKISSPRPEKVFSSGIISETTGRAVFP
jgi:hypothetical protein